MTSAPRGVGPARVLVTGAGGQLGLALRATVDAWRPTDAEIVFVTRAEVDLADADSVQRVVASVAPRLIVNAAAYTAVDRAETDESTAMAVNGAAPGLLASAMAAIGGAIVHFSTDYVFDGTATVPYVEDAKTNPLSVYGRTKLAGEEAVRASGAAHWIVRTSWVYAESGANFLRTMMRLADGRESISVVADQRGAPIDALRLATIVAAMLNRRDDATGQTDRSLDAAIAGVVASSGTYHASAAGVTTWHAYARHVIDGLHRRRPGAWTLGIDGVLPTDTAGYPTPARRPPFSVLDHGKLARTFGIVPPPWQEDVDACLDRLLGPVAR